MKNAFLSRLWHYITHPYSCQSWIREINGNVTVCDLGMDHLPEDEHYARNGVRWRPASPGIPGASYPTVPLPLKRRGDTDALGQNFLSRTAESGVETPGCDCGHEGMGEMWHARSCVWRSGIGHRIAHRIRAELVCCDIFQQVQRDKQDGVPNAIGRAMLKGNWHDLCYWGEAAALIAEEYDRTGENPYG